MSDKKYVSKDHYYTSKLSDARGQIAELEAELDKHRWRRVEDEVPEPGNPEGEFSRCLVFVDGSVHTAAYSPLYGFTLYFKPVGEISLWKPITPPEIEA